MREKKCYKEVIIKNDGLKGIGVFANRHFKKGEVVVCGKIVKKLDQRTIHSFQIEINAHVQLNKIARSINHSCDPNTGIKNNYFGGYNFISLRDIEKGEEVTWDYETCEYVSIAVKDCYCQSNNCKKTIKGFNYRTEEIVKKYGIYIADYLKMIFYEQKLVQ